MANVIVAFSKLEDAKNIKRILVKNGFDVVAVCTSGAQTLAQTEELNGGILVCGYRLADMIYSELHDCLSAEFSMLMVSSPSKWTSQMPEDVVCLPMPLKVNDLLSTLEMMVQAQARRKKRMKRQLRQRSEEEQSLLMQAKSILMERNGMTEEEAHRYMQKCSMDSGTNLTETAQMILTILNE